MNDNIIDSYGDFIESKYYLNKYGLVPSLLSLEMPIEETAENMDLLLNKIKEEVEIEILFERWNVSDHKGDEDAADFITYYFIQISEKLVCIQLELDQGNVSINFWYNRNESSSFNWVEENYKKLRSSFGIPLLPTFRVLAKKNGDFYIEKINIRNTEITIETNYNNDFKEIDSIINDSLKLDKSGLILLHGPPGTGKTSYIKNLLSIHKDKNFIFIPNDFVNELIQPDFISFLISHKNSILVIEDAEKVISSREKINSSSVVSTILQLTDGLFSDFLNIKIICTFNTSINNVDKALLRKGRMIAFYEFRELSLEKTNSLLMLLDKETSDEGLTVAEIYYLANKDFKQKERSIGFKNTL